ncbi:MAG: Hpt domain-containing protein [Planctomycetota bacterium]|nr:Hpt domain-containing protein [Planctomycetota bacterium]
MAPHPSAPALDAARVADLRALAGPDMPDLADEVARIFVEASTEGMERLLEATEGGRAPDIAHEAHRLKGSCGNIGAMVLESLCGAIEQDARAGTPVAMAAARGAEAELSRVLEAIAEEFDLGS